MGSPLCVCGAQAQRAEGFRVCKKLYLVKGSALRDELGAITA